MITKQSKPLNTSPRNTLGKLMEKMNKRFHWLWPRGMVFLCFVPSVSFAENCSAFSLRDALPGRQAGSKSPSSIGRGWPHLREVALAQSWGIGWCWWGLEWSTFSTEELIWSAWRVCLRTLLEPRFPGLLITCQIRAVSIAKWKCLKTLSNARVSHVLDI